ncbi:MAG: DUF1080 domain-containing protein [Bryobacteraceae bacterium]|nr:DUF1080 domain-containing protein [Bryobacteraceae bacterium]MDW8376954.1 DUF1080 domain-containing protein [Bryobacterales bacterium]
MKTILVCFACLLLFHAQARAQLNSLTPKEAAEGWVLLFDGESMFGWTPEGGAEWRVVDGALVADRGESGYLRSNAVFADYILKCEFRSAPDGNSGIFLRSAKLGQPHVTGYELQIYDQHEKFKTGSLVNHAVAKPARITGGWQSYEVELRGDRILVRLDGKKVLETRDSKSLVGHIGLQYNKGKKIEFRNLKVKPLGLAPIFDGKTLAGWRETKHPRAKEPPTWSVRNGLLHVEKGPGQLETEATFDDFVLQIDIRANAPAPDKHPNSGIFLRGEPNVSWSGYESQIRNEYKDGDCTQPVDFGTGGIYHYQPARKVVANDNQFFTKTIVARGRHFSVWVNGFPVTSWEDPHPEGNNVRQKQAKLTPGVISLQAHDPTTNLDFKNIRIARLPR